MEQPERVFRSTELVSEIVKRKKNKDGRLASKNNSELQAVDGRHLHSEREQQHLGGYSQENCVEKAENQQGPHLLDEQRKVIGAPFVPVLRCLSTRSPSFINNECRKHIVQWRAAPKRFEPCRAITVFSSNFSIFT